MSWNPLQKGIFILAITLFWLSGAQSQSHINGVIPEKPEKLDAIEFMDFIHGLKRGEALPDSYDLLNNTTIKADNQLKVLDQGRINSCVAIATAHAYSILYAWHTVICRTESHPVWQDFSASFVFNLIKQSKSGENGSRFSDAFDLILKKGICPADSFPNSSYTCAEMPTEKHFKAAAAFTLSSYNKLISNSIQQRISQGKSTRMDQDTIIAQVKGALYRKNPVIIGARLSQSFQNATCSDNCWNFPGNAQERTMLHAIVITAYNQNCFKVLNTLGSQWGCNGFIEIDQKEMAKMIQTAFILMPPTCD